MCHVYATVLLLISVSAYDAVADSTTVAGKPPACEGRLPHPEKLDEKSVREAEHGWLAAEMSGDTDTLECLLDDGYTNLSFDGKTYPKSDIVKHAAAKKGKDLPLPVVELTIVVQGTGAIAYSVQNKHDGSGKPITVYFADSLEFHDGAWHALFSVDSVVAPPDLQIKD